MQKVLLSRPTGRVRCKLQKESSTQVSKRKSTAKVPFGIFFCPHTYIDSHIPTTDPITLPLAAHARTRGNDLVRENYVEEL